MQLSFRAHLTPPLCMSFDSWFGGGLPIFNPFWGRGSLRPEKQKCLAVLGDKARRALTHNEFRRSGEES